VIRIQEILPEILQEVSQAEEMTGTKDPEVVIVEGLLHFRIEIVIHQEQM